MRMPAVAISVCQRCGTQQHEVLVDTSRQTTMPACDCGGLMQVSRIFYDRRLSDEPGWAARRADDPPI